MADNEETVVVTVTGPDGIERDYAQDVVIPFAGKQFAVLVSIPESEDDDSDPEVILARIDTDQNGDYEYVPPTDEEYDAVAAIYNEM